MRCGALRVTWKSGVAELIAFFFLVLVLISRERIVTFARTVRPRPSGTSKLKHVGAEKIKSSSCSVDPDFHTSNKQETPHQDP